METLTELVKRDGITLEVIARPTATIFDDDGWRNFPWTVRLKDGPVYPGNTLDLPYRTGSGLTLKDGKTPTTPAVIDVMASLVLEAQGYDNTCGFEDWASDYGYDDDSRKAESLYREVKAQTDRFKTFLGDKFSEYMECEVDW